MKRTLMKAALLGTCAAAIATAGSAETFNIPGGDLKSALDAYTRTTGDALIVSDDLIAGARTHGVQGAVSSNEALGAILKGTGFKAQRSPSGAIGIVRAPDQSSRIEINDNLQLAQASPSRAAVETVTVTSSKLGGADVQSIPIAITALSQEQLTATQTAGGPDLIKQVPNMTFTKTNFSGYSIQIRGIGTQAISVTTDPAVAVAFNDIPFIRNHFFEQEFYDLSQVEVLRGPQGTLYGRNATAGVVNLTSAKPTDQFEAMASGEFGNYRQRRFEGMINLPIVDDRLDIRIAGEWTKRQGYSYNEISQDRIDDRDLWSGRVTLSVKPLDGLQLHLVWEHFQENDDRMRTAKQLCKTALGRTEIDGIELVGGTAYKGIGLTSFTSQGCEPASFYSSEAFQVPNGFALPYGTPTAAIGGVIYADKDMYAGTTQSQNLRIISTALDPVYKVKNDILALNAEYKIAPTLTLISQTGFSNDFQWATEDYNRFNTAPGVFDPNTFFDSLGAHAISPEGVFCDPQLGCSDRLVAQDLVTAHSWQLSQELRVVSHFDGPFNFSLGGNYLHYETSENYYVFINALTALAAVSGGTSTGTSGMQYVPGATDNRGCLSGGYGQYGDPTVVSAVNGCKYIDPNPLDSLNNQGHNYFLSQNPYGLNSYAMFGETNYAVTSNLSFIAGLRWTEDQKHALQIPSELLVAYTYGYPALPPIDQQWDQFTGRAVADWTPDLGFTDKTLIFGSYAHGYKAGGANPPPIVVILQGPQIGQPSTVISATHPATFKPEFVDAFEIGTKNSLLENSLTFNASLFYYNYQNYQISQIVDRTAINLNFDAHIKGAEVEATWEPLPGLRFNFSGGYEDARLAQGSKAIDLIDRADAANHPDWMVIKPFPTNPSNCIIPDYVAVVRVISCNAYLPNALRDKIDPITNLPYGTGMLPAGYAGFDPNSAPNNGEGFYKDLGHNRMPNAPPFTASFGAQYSLPVSADWAATLRSDMYWQDNSYWRVFNDLEYDKLHGYASLNLTLILTSQNGWQVMGYMKNVFNTTAITGAFLNSDDSGLTTNVFLTDPKLIGVRVTKNW